MTTTSYAVLGLRCGACLAEVMEEVRSLPGVRAVAVDLVKGGASPVWVTASVPPAVAALRAAVESAGFTLSSAVTPEQSASTSHDAGLTAAHA